MTGFATALITLKDGKPTFKGRTVILPIHLNALLVSNGEGGSITIFKAHIKYATKSNDSNIE